MNGHAYVLIPNGECDKAADLLMSMADLQRMLLQLTLDDKKGRLEGEHAALSAQHAADTQRIQELETQLTALRAHRCEIKTVPDPEHEKTRQQYEMLKSIAKFLAGVSLHKEQTAIRAIQQLPADAARLLSVQEELIESERRENAARQATMETAWRRQMGL